MENNSTKPIPRLGFHYYPDTKHYRESDLRAWLPKIRSLGASWLTLIAPPNRAIPEPFLRGLLDEGVEPLVHFPLPLSLPLNVEDLYLIFDTYAGWGVRYVSLFDRPNLRRSWPTTAWTQADLVERFLDIYLPLGEAITDAGLTPVFPPLQPGGDYWDTAFLRAALQGMDRRGHRHLLAKLVLGAYGWVDEHRLTWGIGGPERWPGSRPYHTPLGQEDQRGFYIFSWYLAISQAVLGKSRPVVMLKAGPRPLDQSRSASQAPDTGLDLQKFMALIRLIAGQQLPMQESSGDKKGSTNSDIIEGLPQELLACNLWLLATDPESPYKLQAWFQPDGSLQPTARSWKKWLSNGNGTTEQMEDHKETVHHRAKNQSPTPWEASSQTLPGLSSIVSKPGQPIDHYLLLPLYEWGVAEWHLDVIRPFVKKYHPTIGFSLAEASHASHVTIIGGDNAFPDHVIQQLRSSGCQVERIKGDGTHIATQLASL